MFWLKLFSICAQCCFTFIATTTQTKDKETNKLTKYGKVVAVGVILSTLFTIIIASTEQRDKTNAAAKQAQLDSTRKALDSVTIAFQHFTIHSQDSLLNKQQAVITKMDTSLSQQLLIKDQTLLSLNAQKAITKTSTTILDKVATGITLQEEIKKNSSQNLENSKVLAGQQGILLTNTERTINPLFPCNIRSTISIPFSDPRAEIFLKEMEKKREKISENKIAPFNYGVSFITKNTSGEITSFNVIDSASYFLYNRLFSFAGTYFDIYFTEQNPVTLSEDHLTDNALNIKYFFVWPVKGQPQASLEKASFEIKIDYLKKALFIYTAIPDVKPNEIHETKFYGLNDLVDHYAVIIPHGLNNGINMESISFMTGSLRARIFNIKPVTMEMNPAGQLRIKDKFYVHKFGNRELGF